MLSMVGMAPEACPTNEGMTIRACHDPEVWPSYAQVWQVCHHRRLTPAMKEPIKHKEPGMNLR